MGEKRKPERVRTPEKDEEAVIGSVVAAMMRSQPELFERRSIVDGEEVPDGGATSPNRRHHHPRHRCRPTNRRSSSAA
jgi:hypothetical protein